MKEYTSYDRGYKEIIFMARDQGVSGVMVSIVASQAIDPGSIPG